MSDSQVVCRDEQRRDAVRRSKLFGLDYLEVEQDRKTLKVTFLGMAPEQIGKDNVLIGGGRRITGIQVTADPEIHRSDDPEGDDWMTVHVDEEGDFSTYTLSLVEKGGAAPLSGFDPRYSSVGFSFMVDCPSELDCKTQIVCPPQEGVAPEIDYLAKDYESFRQLMFDRLALTVPQWREQNPADIGVALVEVLAYVGDRLSYYQDAVATEAYLNTARQRISVRRHARLVDYFLHEGCNARTWVHLESAAALDLKRDDFYLITRVRHAALSARPVIREADLEGVDPADYEVFQVIPAKIHLNPAQNLINFYTWDDFECCLPAGSTRATLDGDQGLLGLKLGSFLLFEETIGPRTGQPEDADPNHRQVVRLTSVLKSTDPLTGKAVTEIQWGEQDALSFSLCLSSVAGPANDCQPLSNVSVARGNVFPADHGRPRTGLTPVQVPVLETQQHCEGFCGDKGILSDPVEIAGPFGPVLRYGPLTYAQALPANAPASTLLTQDPAKCLPSLTVTDSSGTAWTPAPDLLESEGSDARYVVEVDDQGLAHLRFGDGDLGRAPAPGATFAASYRVGIGPAGNIGAESLRQIVFRNGFVDGLSVRNPLPATGGIDPEPIAQIKQFAPYAFRDVLARAITPDDYATLAQAPYEPRVRRAEARFLWTGSWYEVAVAIDPDGDVPEADFPALVEQVQRDLYRYRRIGHDVRARIARSVAVDLVLHVCVKPDYLRGHVEAALLDALGNRTLPDGSTGFFHPDNLDLGVGVAVSRIVAAAQAIAGVDSVTVTKLHRKFERPDGELEAGILRVQAWEVPRLDNDPSLPENGTLKIKLRGGR